MCRAVASVLVLLQKYAGFEALHAFIVLGAGVSVTTAKLEDCHLTPRYANEGQWEHCLNL